MAAGSKPQPVHNPKIRTRARHLGDLMTGVLADTVARRSGMTLDLLAAWDDIAGPDYAGHTRPERIRWPKQVTDNDPFEPGLLEIACDGAKALFLQHESHELLSRVNVFFGFEAVSRMRIIQKPVANTQLSKRELRPLTKQEEARLQSMLDGVSDPLLRERLAKLGHAVIVNSAE